MAKSDNLMICPKCKSDNVIKKKQAGCLIMLSILLFGLPIPFFKKSYYCFDCEKEWKINEK